MNWLTYNMKLLVLALGVVTPLSICAQTSPPDSGAKCSILMTLHKQGAADPELVKSPGKAIFKRMTMERACQISYRFAGGEKSVPLAKPEEIKADFDRLRLLFSYYDKLPSSDRNELALIPDADPNDDLEVEKEVEGLHKFRETHPGLSTKDAVRLMDISRGWDREQVTLLGRFYLMQSLRLHGNISECASMFDQMRGRLSIKARKLDYGEQSTYFTRQTLQNLIAIQGFAAKAALPNTSLKQDGALIADYLDNREALFDLMQYEWATVKPVDLDLMLEKKLGDTKRLGLGTDEWDSQHRLSHLAGSIVEDGQTVLFIKGKQLHAVSLSPVGVTLMEPSEAGDMLSSFYKREIKSRSTSDMSLFSVLKFPDNSFEVDIDGNEVPISPSDFVELKEGRPLSDTHPLTIALKLGTAAKVLYANPLMQYSGSELKEADEFVFAVQKSYPTLAIYRDPLSADTNERVNDLRAFTASAPSKITAIVADDSFRPRIDDFSAIASVKAELLSAGVDVVPFKDGENFQWTKGKGKGVIVITGHSNEALAEFVKKLGESGAFEGNYVLFNSCETELTRSLVNEIDSKYKAAATFTHEGSIRVKDLRSFLSDFSQRLSNAGQQNFGQLLMDSLHAHGLNGVWTVSEVFQEGSVRR